MGRAVGCWSNFRGGWQCFRNCWAEKIEPMPTGIFPARQRPSASLLHKNFTPEPAPSDWKTIHDCSGREYASSCGAKAYGNTNPQFQIAFTPSFSKWRRNLDLSERGANVCNEARCSLSAICRLNSSRISDEARNGHKLRRCTTSCSRILAISNSELQGPIWSMALLIMPSDLGGIRLFMNIYIHVLFFRVNFFVRIGFRSWEFETDLCGVVQSVRPQIPTTLVLQSQNSLNETERGGRLILPSD